MVGKKSGISKRLIPTRVRNVVGAVLGKEQKPSRLPDRELPGFPKDGSFEERLAYMRERNANQGK